MTPLFQPDPALVALFTLQKFFYLPILAAIALPRVVLGAGLSRWPALAALILCVGGIVTVFAPALGWNSGPVYVWAAQAMAEGGGRAALLVPSALFVMSSLIPRARWRWLDILHVILIFALVGLIWWTS